MRNIVSFVFASFYINALKFALFTWYEKVFG